MGALDIVVIGIGVVIALFVTVGLLIEMFKKH